MNEKLQHLLVLGTIAQLPEDQQQKIKEEADKIREITKTDEGKMALALVATEIAAK